MWLTACGCSLNGDASGYCCHNENLLSELATLVEPDYLRNLSRLGLSIQGTADNSAMERFFGGLKSEFFHHHDWSGVVIAEFCRMLDVYLGHYNEERPKEKSGWMSPTQYRRSQGLAAWPVQENACIPIWMFFAYLTSRQLK